MRQIKKLLALVLALVMTMGLATIGAEAKVTDNGTGDLGDVTLSGALAISGTATYKSLTVEDKGTLILDGNAKVTIDTLKVEDGGTVQLTNSGAGALTVNKELTVEKGATFEGNSKTDPAALTTGTDAKVSVDDSVKENIKKIADGTTDTKIENGSSETPSEETKSFTVTVNDIDKLPEGVAVKVSYTDKDKKAVSGETLTASKNTFEIYEGGSDITVLLTGAKPADNIITFQWTIDGTKKDAEVVKSNIEAKTTVSDVKADASLNISVQAKEEVVVTIIGKFNGLPVDGTDVKASGRTLNVEEGNTNGVYLVGGLQNGDVVTITNATAVTNNAVLTDGTKVVAKSAATGNTIQVQIPSEGNTFEIDLTKNLNVVYYIAKDTTVKSFVVKDAAGETLTKLATDGDYELYKATAKTITVTLNENSGTTAVAARVDSKGTTSVYFDGVVTNNNCSLYNEAADTKPITLATGANTKAALPATPTGGNKIKLMGASYVDLTTNSAFTAGDFLVGKTALPVANRILVPASATITGKTGISAAKKASTTGIFTDAATSFAATEDLTLVKAVQVEFDSTIKEVRALYVSGTTKVAAADFDDSDKYTKLSSGAFVDPTVYLYCLTYDTTGKQAVINVSTEAADYATATDFAGTGTASFSTVVAANIAAAKGQAGTSNLKLTAGVKITNSNASDILIASDKGSITTTRFVPTYYVLNFTNLADTSVPYHKGTLKAAVDAGSAETVQLNGADVKWIDTKQETFEGYTIDKATYAITFSVA